MNLGYVNSDFIIDRFLRDTDFDEKDIHETDIVEWITTCIRKISINKLYLEKIADCSGDNDPCVEIVNYRGELPCDFVSLIKARRKDSIKPLKSGTDDFFRSKAPLGLGSTSNSTNEKYQVREGYIFTDFKEGTIEIKYLAMPLDVEGKPEIVDDEVVIDAIVSFITYRLIAKLSFRNPVYRGMKEEYKQIWVGNLLKAQSHVKMPTFDEALSVAVFMRSMHSRISLNDHSFKDFGEVSR